MKKYVLLILLTFSAGETEFGLQKTMETRVKLLKQYETVEALRFIFIFCFSLTLLRIQAPYQFFCNNSKN